MLEDKGDRPGEKANKKPFVSAEILERVGSSVHRGDIGSDRLKLTGVLRSTHIGSKVKENSRTSWIRVVLISNIANFSPRHARLPEIESAGPSW